jgi:type III secretion protein V
LIQAILEKVEELPIATANPVILTTIEVRKKLRNFIERDFPQLAVLCYQELAPELNVQPIARITWS